MAYSNICPNNATVRGTFPTGPTAPTPPQQERPHLRGVRLVLQDDAPLGWKRSRQVLAGQRTH